MLGPLSHPFVVAQMVGRNTLIGDIVDDEGLQRLQSLVIRATALRAQEERLLRAGREQKVPAAVLSRAEDRMQAASRSLERVTLLSKVRTQSACNATINLTYLIFLNSWVHVATPHRLVIPLVPLP